MNRRFFLAAGAAAVVAGVLVAVFLLTGLRGRLFAAKSRETQRTRIIIPKNSGASGADLSPSERMAYEDSLITKVALKDGEQIISVLTQDFDGDPADEQIVAYRSLLEIESPVYLTYIEFDNKAKEYRRVWTAPTAAARPGTISLFTQDLIGDRSFCVILTGMNSQGEHTMTVFRQNKTNSGQLFIKIAELRIDGSITIQETERTLAYQQGITKGQSFTIAAYGHDNDSANMLDQLETVYAFNPVNGLYERNKVTKIPGSQIEQRRLRQLLSGEPGVFENFINDLWYYVSPQGTLDSRQYLYFDPASREIIFFGDETQQVFHWQNSTPTRYGLYVSSQNISITTLRRFLDIELESLDSIRLRVFEDVRLKIAVSGSWDGSYRRAAAGTAKAGEPSVKAGINALYDSTWGRLRFFPSGECEINSSGSIRKGRYVFFRVNGQELLELRFDKPENAERQVYRVDARKTESSAMSLSRVRLGASGIQDLHEGAVILTAAQ